MSSCQKKLYKNWTFYVVDVEYDRNRCVDIESILRICFSIYPLIQNNRRQPS